MSESEPKKPEILSVPGSGDPSYPDRQRIDSDVRAFLREPSTPWIVFDKDSRVDREELRRSYLSAGAFILQSGRKSILPDEAFAAAPVAPAAEVEAETKPEPSGLSVASDIEVPEAVPTFRPMSIDIEVDEPEEPQAADVTSLVARSKHTTWLAIAGGATVAVVAALLALGGSSPKAEAKVAAAKAPTTVAAPARAAEEIPPPEETAKPAAETPKAEAPKPEPVKVAAKTESGKPHSKFGRFVINGDARYKNVFFDGKRMLGKGTRSFAVLCGTHTVAVNDKSDAREIEIPCDGEYAVSK